MWFQYIEATFFYFVSYFVIQCYCGCCCCECLGSGVEQSTKHMRTYWFVIVNETMGDRKCEYSQCERYTSITHTFTQTLAHVSTSEWRKKNIQLPSRITIVRHWVGIHWTRVFSQCDYNICSSSMDTVWLCVFFFLFGCMCVCVCFCAMCAHTVALFKSCQAFM